MKKYGSFLDGFFKKKYALFFLARVCALTTVSAGAAILHPPNFARAQELAFASGGDLFNFEYQEDSSLGDRYLRILNEIATNCARAFTVQLSSSGSRACLIEFARNLDFSTIPSMAKIIQSTGYFVFEVPGGLRSNCTATLLQIDLLITARHCVRTNRGDAIWALFIPNYYDRRSASSLPRYRVDISKSLIDRSSGLDVAIHRIHREPNTHPIDVRYRDPIVGETAYIVHHPAGAPASITSFNCRILSEKDNLVYHSCDTFGGSSGALIYSATDHAIIGVHVRGASSANTGILFSDIVNQSAVLSQIAVRIGVPQRLDGTGDPFDRVRYSWDRLLKSISAGESYLLQSAANRGKSISHSEGDALFSEIYSSGRLSRNQRAQALKSLIDLGYDPSDQYFRGVPFICWGGLTSSEKDILGEFQIC